VFKQLAIKKPYVYNSVIIHHQIYQTYSIFNYLQFQVQFDLTNIETFKQFVKLMLKQR